MIERVAALISNAIVTTQQHAHEVSEQVTDTAHTAMEHATDTLHVVAGHGVDTLHAMAGHAAEHGAEHAGHPELPNWLEFAHILFPNSVTQFLVTWQVPIFSAFVWLLLSFFAMKAYSKRSLVPGKLQNLLEFIVEALDNLVVGILGESGRKYTPFLGTIFVYVFTMNVIGLFPGMFSSTSKLTTTLSMAVCVFLYVQYHGMRELGVLGYFHHLAGSPKSTVEWCLVPLNLPLHIIGELAKPISLSLRLFGNISGEDMLLAIFVSLGIASMAFLPHSPFIPGLPLQLPFIFLALLTSFVQALVFTLLSTIYFSLMSHHEEEGHH